MEANCYLSVSLCCHLQNSLGSLLFLHYSAESAIFSFMRNVVVFSGAINSESYEISDAERSIRSMQHDMTKLNTLLHINRNKQESVLQDNVLLENDFVSALKVRECFVHTRL